MKHISRFSMYITLVTIPAQSSEQLFIPKSGKFVATNTYLHNSYILVGF